MNNNHSITPVEIWGGIECTYNRVGNDYFDQLQYAGHYDRESDLEQIAALGITKMRYPVLWEKHQPNEQTAVDWQPTASKLNQMKQQGIEPIAGLVHHGSGPAYINMASEDFAEGLGRYAALVAQQFPWINYYTPVNEPLTTARFCGLYGIWHPHLKDSYHFAKILLNECKGTVLAMQAIRKVNPDAKLVQTDDLGKTHSTPLLQYQAEFENHRRWLTFDLLCAKVEPDHPMWQYLTWIGITEQELQFFLDNPCPPDVIGINHYLTSERYLDEKIENYPPHTYGHNGQHHYADVEAVRVAHVYPAGPYELLKETCERYPGIPVAVTEVHLHCTREEQMRWLHEVWTAANRLQTEGYPVIAITAWAILGSHGWNKLLTQPNGTYEPGIFDVRTGQLRSTALGHMLQAYSEKQHFEHPVLKNNGWWKRVDRIIYRPEDHTSSADIIAHNSRPILILGKTTTLSKAYARVLSERGIIYEQLGRQELDITNLIAIEKTIIDKNPWAVINTTDFSKIDAAEGDRRNCFLVNTYGAQNLALLCKRYGVKLLTFSTDLVFNGSKNQPYTESDKQAPLNTYGESKTMAEKGILKSNSDALIIRTGAFFGPWDEQNFIQLTLRSLQRGQQFVTVSDVSISPTYLPDMIHVSLDLMLDDEKGIWHLTNRGEVTWANLAYAVAEHEGYSTGLIIPKSINHMGLKAKRPTYSALQSEKGIVMPMLHDAINRYFYERAC
ncbi:sugar nucleotide-binding protein [Mucilaginibacter robiniae]|uniref:dTDP-4-dehydrorhamnose reductase n=1 Tax=Mucilaginibacter robiniae TaxID=2728022 RepID=A0A7L5E1N7_9SPHI|nr:family 1 glycosylhydrolase [Mucilaginibacter robiniae]QJD97085.1 sugar nucleotide-binding protein [Mucilaginibacter robiniae]